MKKVVNFEQLAIKELQNIGFYTVSAKGKEKINQDKRISVKAFQIAKSYYLA